MKIKIKTKLREAAANTLSLGASALPKAYSVYVVCVFMCEFMCDVGRPKMLGMYTRRNHKGGCDGPRPLAPKHLYAKLCLVGATTTQTIIMILRSECKLQK
jgi:hypothetical protein